MDRLSDTIRGELGRFGIDDDLGAVVDRWPAAVGRAIARNAWPSRLGRDGTLYVNTRDTIWAFELAQQALEIAARAGVSAIRFSVGQLAGSEFAVEDRPPLVPALEHEVAATELAAGIESQDLRQTIENVIKLSLARNASGPLV